MGGKGEMEDRKMREKGEGREEPAYQ